MKAKVFWWAYVAFALASLYFFCRITCAPVRMNSTAHLHDSFLIIAFAIGLILHFGGFIKRKIFLSKFK